MKRPAQSLDWQAVVQENHSPHDMLSQRANNFEAVPRGAYAVDLPQNVISHMAWRMFPPKTPTESNEWKWAYYQVARQARNKKWVDLLMPDMAGEAIAAEVDSPSTFRVIENLVARSRGRRLGVYRQLVWHMYQLFDG